MKTSKAQFLTKRSVLPLNSVYNTFKPIVCLCIFIIFATSPFSLFADENIETIEQEAGFYYTVKKGDTLWNLSERFSDSPWLWPDLWKENSQIANPHWIYPGNRVRLFHKEWVKKFEKPVEQVAVEPEKEPVYYFYRDMDTVGFIKKEAVAASAVIFKEKDNKLLISEGDLVYLRKETENDFIPGSRYTIYRTLKPIKDNKTGDYIGIQHYITGIVEILKEEPQFAIGKVIKSFRAIQINDKLMPYIRRSPRIPLTQSTKGVLGNIIVSEEHQDLFGDHSIAFIDKGIKEGIKPGQFYRLFYQDKATLNPGAKKKVLLSPYEFGELLVLHTEETTSTVIIMNSQDPVNPNAKIRSLQE